MVVDVKGLFIAQTKRRYASQIYHRGVSQLPSPCLRIHQYGHAKICALAKAKSTHARTHTPHVRAHMRTCSKSFERLYNNTIQHRKAHSDAQSNVGHREGARAPARTFTAVYQYLCQWLLLLRVLRGPKHAEEHSWGRAFVSTSNNTCSGRKSRHGSQASFWCSELAEEKRHNDSPASPLGCCCDCIMQGNVVRIHIAKPDFHVSAAHELVFSSGPFLWCFLQPYSPCYGRASMKEHGCKLVALLENCSYPRRSTFIPKIPGLVFFVE